MSITSENVRKMFKEGDDKRDEGLKTPESIERFDDIFYGDNHEWQMLDVYKPKEAHGQLPVIISIHGGGWVYGDKERYQFYCMDLATRGFAVVNFTYRLAPEFQFPAPLIDTNLVVEWVLQNADNYGFDVDNIFAVGDSAGAHILGLYSAICTNKAYADTLSIHPPKNFVPKAIALNSGAYQIDFDEESDDLTQKLMGDFLPQKGTDNELELINVTKHITEEFPPVFVMTATGDFLINQPKILIPKLMEKNISFQFHFYGNEKKPLGHVFHLNMRSDDAKICNDETCDFFRRI